MTTFFIPAIVMILAMFASANAQNNCNYWFAKVDRSVRLPEKPKTVREAEEKEVLRLREALRNGELTLLKPKELKPNEELNGLTPIQVQKGIKCLLKLEGKTGEAAFSGATRLDTSQIFEPARVEVAALFYISYLYYKEWDSFSGGVALTGTDGKISSAETVSKAYKYYREWFKSVRKIGIVKAREQKLAPLKDKDVRWY